MSNAHMAGGPAFGDEPVVRAADRELALHDLTYLNRMTTVGQVLPNVAHELNNALQVIGGMVEMLSANEGLAPEVRDKVRRIGAQSSRATDLLRDLVTFARRDDAGTSLVDVTKLVERALTFRRYHLARARIAVTVGGASAGQTLSRLDGSYVQQILLNLVINAEHSLAGRTDGRIDIQVERRDVVIEVRVTDNGEGVSDALIERVTRPFFTTRVPAAGLGLTVSAGLARALGGSVRLSRGPDGGTVATLTLPAAD